MFRWLKQKFSKKNVVPVVTSDSMYENPMPGFTPMRTNRKAQTPSRSAYESLFSSGPKTSYCSSPIHSDNDSSSCSSSDGGSSCGGSD